MKPSHPRKPSSKPRVPPQKRSKSVSAAAVPVPSSQDTRRPSAPPAVEMPRLSIADKFMASNYPPPKPPSISTTSVISVAMSLHSLASSSKKDPEPGKLTIADAFMKSSTSSPTTRSRAASFADELEKPSQVHPLEPQKKSTFFEDTGANLDLSLLLSSPTSSIHPPSSRPWGSQETLVHLQDKSKKPIYTQYMDEEYEEIDMDEHWSEYDEDEDEEKATSYNPSIVESTAKLRQPQPTQPALPPPITTTTKEEGHGVWVGCCFISCRGHKARKFGFSRRGWVFCTFLSLIVFVLIAYFLWPRTPLMRIEGASLTSPAKITETKQGVMVGNVAFESEWLVNITVDNRQNHVPTRLVQVQVIAKDALTGLIIGKGVHNDDPNPEHVVLAPNMISTIQIPIRVDYQARDSTDTTFVDLSKACAPHRFVEVHTMREALPLHFWITLHFFGLDWLGYKPTVIATPATGGFACPQL